MSHEEFAEQGPLSREQAAAEQTYVYEQVGLVDFDNSEREPYTAEDLFERNKFNLTGEQEKTLFSLLAFNESALTDKLGARAETIEGREMIIAALVAAIAHNESQYSEDVEDADPDLSVDYSYPDILTDVTTWKGEKEKQKLFSVLSGPTQTYRLIELLEEDLELYEEMGEDITEDILAEAFYTKFGYPLDDPEVPFYVRNDVLGLATKPETVEE